MKSLPSIPQRGQQMIQLSKLLTQAHLDYQDRLGRTCSQAEFSRWLGITPAQYRRWLYQETLPNCDNTQMLAEKIGPEIYDILDFPPPQA
jgi:hypothetical protein